MAYRDENEALREENRVLSLELAELQESSGEEHKMLSEKMKRNLTTVAKTLIVALVLTIGGSGIYGAVNSVNKRSSLKAGALKLCKARFAGHKGYSVDRGITFSAEYTTCNFYRKKTKKMYHMDPGEPMAEIFVGWSRGHELIYDFELENK